MSAATEREDFYDETIAPELLRLAKMCQEKGMSFVAGVEYEPGDVGRTAFLTTDAVEGMRLANRNLQFDSSAIMVVTTVTKPEAT